MSEGTEESERPGDGVGSVAGAAGKAPERTCRCGHRRDHVMVSPVGDYGFWGWFLMMFGISATPHKIHFRCRVCEQDVDTTTDPQTLRETRLS